MLKRLAACLLFLATAAFANQGIINPIVASRMDGMAGLDYAMQRFAAMLNGYERYNRSRALQIREALIAETASIPTRFASPESDPNSEARPEIWTSAPGFSLMAAEALLAANTLGPTSFAGLRK